MQLQTFILGAGEDVGRSCIILKMYDKMIMLDCGVHMGYNNMHKYPDLTKLQENRQMNPEGRPIQELIDLVLISHFHLDHVGALPYFTETYDYNGPVLMTTPTSAIVPYMLDDFRRVMTDQKYSKDRSHKEDDLYIYSHTDIANCIKKITPLRLKEKHMAGHGIYVEPFYAGHVLGACMFSLSYKDLKVVYTGDFNSAADRHLGAAWIDRIRPHLLITESTYATTLRDNKRAREREFLRQIQNTINNKGKVLIPVFALGRAQELCLLLETFWSRNNMQAPVYFAAGMIDKANFYYRLFVNWTNQQIQSSFSENNMMHFKHIFPFDRKMIKSPESMVLFATPGMLHAGLSMQVFKEWCHDERNLLIIPGYCVAGTLGNKLLQGVDSISLDGKEYQVKMRVLNMSFSAHADARGILNLIHMAAPQNVMLVHGEKRKMIVLAEIIKDNFGLDTLHPANWTHSIIKVQIKSNIYLSMGLPTRHWLASLRDVPVQVQAIDILDHTMKRYLTFLDHNRNAAHQINELLCSLTQNDSTQVMTHTLGRGLSLRIDKGVLEFYHYNETDLCTHFRKLILQYTSQNDALLVKYRLSDLGILENYLANLPMSVLFDQLLIEQRVHDPEPRLMQLLESQVVAAVVERQSEGLMMI